MQALFCFSITIPSGRVPQIPLVVPIGRDCLGIPEKQPVTLRMLTVHPRLCFFSCFFLFSFFFSSYWRNHRLTGDFQAWCCTGVGKGQCGQCIAYLLTLLMWSVLVSIMQVGRYFSLSPVSSVFLSAVLYVNSC